MNKHTPGPWFAVADKGKTIIRTSRSSAAFSPLAIVKGDKRDTIKDQEANARLIAAAPDLLEALERILEQPLTGNPSHKRLIEHWEYERSLGNGYAKDQLFALSAIAKAKGE